MDFTYVAHYLSNKSNWSQKAFLGGSSAQSDSERNKWPLKLKLTFYVRCTALTVFLLLISRIYSLTNMF